MAKFRLCKILSRLRHKRRRAWMIAGAVLTLLFVEELVFFVASRGGVCEDLARAAADVRTEDEYKTIDFNVREICLGSML
jgi:hypothetical protein